MVREDGESRPARTFNRRRMLRGATVGGAGLLGLASLSYMPVMAHSMAGMKGMNGRPQQDVATHDTMRKLWEDHIVWTRGFIVSFAAGLPNLDATTQRLLRNQVDIGDAFKPFFGDAAGAQLSQLLTDHILGAAGLLTAAKAGDTAGVNQASADWYANANDIAAFFAGLDPRDWPLADMQTMMKDHLDLTLAESVAELQGDWAGSVAAYDRVHDEILQMADMLASGLSSRGHQ